VVPPVISANVIRASHQLVSEIFGEGQSELCTD
jgi:hypothetical protein